MTKIMIGFIFLTSPMSWAQTQETISDQTTQTSLSAPPPAVTVIRDAGIGLGVGALAGLSFVLFSQGRFPSGNQEFENQAFLTGMSVGTIGGAMTGYWEVKRKQARDRSLEVAVQPPLPNSPGWHLSAAFEF